MSSQTAWSAPCVQKPCLRKEQLQMKAEAGRRKSKASLGAEEVPRRPGPLSEAASHNKTYKENGMQFRVQSLPCMCETLCSVDNTKQTQKTRKKKSERKDRRMFDKMSNPKLGKTIRMPRTRQAWWHMPVFTSVS